MSAVLPEGRLVEMVFDPAEQRTRFVLWQNGIWRFESVVRAPVGERLIPYSAHNNLIKKEVVLFPSEPCDYGSETELVSDIQSFIHRYVDVSPRFERIASYYVLFSWLYDGFAELPYLRLRGDYGSGKTGAGKSTLLAPGLVKHLEDARGGKGTFVRRDPFEGIVAIRLIGIGHVEVDQVLAPLGRDCLRDARDQVTVGIEQRKALAPANVLQHHGFEQGRFAGTGLADDVDVGKPVLALDAKPLALIAELGTGKKGDGVW